MTRVVAYPSGQFVLERELGDTPELTGEVLDGCFDAAGIVPTADDVALVQTALWSNFLSLELSELPPEGVDELTEAALNDFPLDFDNYEGPIVEEVAGVRTAVFVAEDQVSNFYVVQTVLDPDVSSTASVVYVG